MAQLPATYLSLAYPPTGKGIYKNLPPSFSPDAYDGLIAWYDSNSATQGAGGVISAWNDKTPYANTIYPQSQGYISYPVATVLSNLASNEDITLDSIGNLYLTVGGCNCIRMYPAVNGVYFGQNMTVGNNYVIAGINGAAGSYSGDTGLATSANLNHPRGAFVDSKSNLYICDDLNFRLRMVPAKSGPNWGVNMTGCNIYTIAGTGVSGTPVDGTLASSSAFTGHIWNAACDSNNSIYIADNNSIRMIPAKTGVYWGISMTGCNIYTLVNSTGGSVSPTAPNVGISAVNAGAAELRGITFDTLGNLFYSDANGEAPNGYIKMLPVVGGSYYGYTMTANSVYLIAGSNSALTATPRPYNCPAINSLITFPTTLYMDSHNNLVISTAGNSGINSLVAIIPRTNTTLYGKSLQANYIYELIGSNGYVAQQNFLGATGAVINNSNSNIYVCDYTLNILYSLSSSNATSFLLSNFDFYNIYCKNSHTMEYKNANTGATIFTVWKPATNVAFDINLTQNLVTLFSDNITIPTDFGSNFSLGIIGTNNISNFYIGCSDLSGNSGNTCNVLTFSSYAGSGSPTNIINAICFNSNYAGSYSRTYLNGICVCSNSTPISLTSSVAYLNLFLGDTAPYTNPYTGTHGGSSYIYEIIVYNTVLSPGQISLVNQYLANKNNTTTLANNGVFSY